MKTDQLKVWSKLSDQPASYYVNANEDEREFFREWVKGILRTQPVTVTFTKANGEIRDMLCTLQADCIPTPINESAGKKKSNNDACAVWDIKQNAWRSFRWDRVKTITFDMGKEILPNEQQT